MVALVRINDDELEYLILGDTTLAVQTMTGVQVIIDDRVEKSAEPERRQADLFPIGSPQKHAALVTMKHAELAVRNQPGGYWVAQADPEAASHAITGRIPASNVARFAVLTDGAARIVQTFDLLDWPSVLDLLDQRGPGEVIRRVRAVESADPDGARWPRNKRHDDATIAFAS
jgi:hypothetical protein